MKEITLDLSGFYIGLKAHGNSHNPPLLALHGWLDNANSFDDLAQRLSDRFYVLAMDIPGHGQSSHLPPNCHYHFMDGIFTVVEVIKALGYKKTHLLGHSMGACLASLIAGVAPEYVHTLALIEGLGPFSSPENTACLQLRDYLIHQLPALHSPRSYHSIIDAAKARAKRGHVSLAIAMKLCERGVLEQDGQFIWRHDRRLLTPSPLRMTEEQVLSILREIKARTFLLWASEGFSFTSEIMQQRMQAIGALQTHTLEGGHHVHMEKPQAVSEMLLEFYSNQN